MSLSVTQRPTVTIESISSDWVASQNPVLYKFLRSDFTFNSVNNNAGKLQVQKNSTDITANFAIGDSVYVKSDDGIYDLLCTVNAISFSTHSYITMDQTYTSSGGTGYGNYITLRAGYYAEVEIYKSDNTLIATANYSPFGNGEINADISAFISSYLNANTDYNYSGAEAQINTNAFIGFYIKYKEVWRGSANSQTSDSANVSWASFSKLQIGNAPHGGNMFLYAKGVRKFLTTITSPVFWRGYKNLLSFIKDDTSSSWVVARTSETDIIIPSELPSVEPLDDWVTAGPGWVTGIANPYVNSADDFDAILSCIFSVNESPPYFTVHAPVKATYSFRIQGTTIATRNAYIRIYCGTIADGYLEIPVPATITGGDITLSGTGTIVNSDGGYVWDKAYIEVFDGEATNHFICTVNSISIDNARTGNVTDIVVGDVDQGVIDFVSVTDDNPTFSLKVTNTTDFSEEITITQEDPCKNPIMLQWRNSLGGVSQWLFSYNQDLEFNYNNQKSKVLTLYADKVTLEQLNYINELNTLGDVYKENIVEMSSSIYRSDVRIGQQVYVVDTDGNKTGVIVIPTSIVTKTKHDLHNIQISIQYPEIYSQ